MKISHNKSRLYLAGQECCTIILALLLLLGALFPVPALAQESEDTSASTNSQIASDLSLYQERQSQALVVKVYYENLENLSQIFDQYDVWDHAVRVNRQPFVTVKVSPEERTQLIEAGYRVEVDQRNTDRLQLLSPLFSGAATQGYNGGFGATIPNYSCYRTVEETYDDLSRLAANNPTIASWIDIGDSWDKETSGGPSGYDIYALKLTNRNIPGPKPPYMVMATIHAREYVTAETATRLAEYFVNNYGVDPDITWLLDYHEVHILPMSNPDGRKIAEGGVLWRKNRNPNNGCSGGDYGIDLNRNHSYEWGGPGSSSSTCSINYRGPSPASEPEVQAIQDYASTVFEDQRSGNNSAPSDTEGVFISIHSYAELVLFPWWYSDNTGPNESDLTTLGRKFGYHNGYEVCSDCYYLASGTSDDWTYGEFGVASYTFEFGTQFFQGCSTYENTIYPDNLPALLYGAKAARLPYQTPSGPEPINLSLSETAVPAGQTVTLNAVMDDTRFDSNGNGNEPTQSIRAARYSIDTPSWRGGQLISMNAADGSFSSNVETVTAQVDTTGLSNGRHTIFVEGQDASGNWGVPTSIFLNIDGTTVLPGDVNCDEQLNVVDALYITQYDVGLRTDSGSCPLSNSSTQIYADAGNISGDSQVNAIDALFILQCTVGISNSFCPQ